jgi:quinol monooxygenase YgiN
MDMVFRVARVGIDPAKRDLVMDEYARYVESVEQDPGVLAWELCADADDDDVIWILAKFADAAAHQHHMSLPETQAVSEVVREALVGAPEFHQLVPQFSVNRQGGMST